MMKVANWMMFLVLVWSDTYIDKSVAQTTLSQYEGDTVTLSCALSGTFTFPEWGGPPSLTKYTNLNDPSGTINPAAPAASRLEYASNNRDLILSNAVISDSGDYKCTFTGVGDHTITLTVNSATTTPDTPDGFEWWKILLIVLGILMWNFLAGIGLGCSCFPKKNRNKKKGKCCCIIEGMPTWYKILWFTGFGTPVAFGIFCVLKCCKQGY